MKNLNNAGDHFEEAIPMNVGTQQAPSRVRPDSMQRRPLSGSDDGLRMEHSGFQDGQDQFYQGAKTGWAHFLASLDPVLARLD